MGQKQNIWRVEWLSLVGEMIWKWYDWGKQENDIEEEID